VRAIIDGWSLFAEVWEMPLGGWSAIRTLRLKGSQSAAVVLSLVTMFNGSQRS
jgi:hypothetical protein